ncbi:Isochorismatase domain-containing protein 1 [Quaeritorhiza haematococci]|nr:Isochorismatase domain-containing protein 1 [Quaeritorhiza haematococci]
MASNVARSLAKIARPTPSTTAFLLCDIQERFRGLIYQYPLVINTASKMVQASKILDIPLVVTEQNPKALGKTVSELDVTAAALVDAKTKFSMLTPNVQQYFTSVPHVQNVVLFGIESHVCVLQTCLDFLENNYNVFVLVDGVSSMNSGERGIALSRMAHSGATLTSSESILFQLMQDAKHEKFKLISNLVKETKDKTKDAVTELGVSTSFVHASL